MKRQIKFLLTALLIIPLAALLFAACSKKPTPNTPEPDQTLESQIESFWQNKATLEWSETAGPNLEPNEVSNDRCLDGKYLALYSDAKYNDVQLFIDDCLLENGFIEMNHHDFGDGYCDIDRLYANSDFWLSITFAGEETDGFASIVDYLGDSYDIDADGTCNLFIGISDYNQDLIPIVKKVADEVWNYWCTDIGVNYYGETDKQDNGTRCIHTFNDMDDEEVQNFSDWLTDNEFEYNEDAQEYYKDSIHIIVFYEYDDTTETLTVTIWNAILF